MSEELVKATEELTTKETSKPEVGQDEQVYKIMIQHYRDTCKVRVPPGKGLPPKEPPEGLALARILMESATQVAVPTVNTFFARIMRFMELACCAAPVASNLPPPLKDDEIAFKIEQQALTQVRSCMRLSEDADVLRVLDAVFFASLPAELKAFIRVNDAWCQARGYALVTVSRDPALFPDLKSWSHVARAVVKLREQGKTPDDIGAVYGTRIQGVAAGERVLSNLKAYYDPSLENIGRYLEAEKKEEGETLKEWDFNTIPFVVTSWFLPIGYDEHRAAWEEMENVSGIIASKSIGGTLFTMCDLLIVLSYFHREQTIKTMLENKDQEPKA